MKWHATLQQGEGAGGAKWHNGKGKEGRSGQKKARVKPPYTKAANEGVLCNRCSNLL